MKAVFGCDSPPQSPDGVWKIGATGDKVELDRCPVRELDGCDDVWELLRFGTLSEWHLSFSEQERLPERYLTAWSLASSEVSRCVLERSKEGKNGR